MLVHTAIQMGVQVKLEDFAVHTLFSIADYYGKVAKKDSKTNVVEKPDMSFSQLKALSGKKIKW